MNGSAQITATHGSTRSPAHALRWALAWAVAFTAMHGYWYLGGRIGLGDAPSLLPGAPASPGGWIFTIVIALMFAAGLAVPIALLHGNSSGLIRRLLVLLLWVGCLFLLVRGASGLVDDAVRDIGLSRGGITGLSYKDTLGTAHPSTYTLVSTAIIDGYFLLGGVLYGRPALACRTARSPGEVSKTHRPGPAGSRWRRIGDSNS